MSLFDAFSYRGKRAVVVGGASGMGAAVAEVVRDAGADVLVLDRAEVKLDGVQTLQVDMSDKASIDEATGQIDGQVHALFSCAGVADGTPGIERINFIGHRRFVDNLIESGGLDRGSAIGFISSAAGLGWQANLEQVQEFLAVTDFDKAVEWIHANGRADYMWSKLSINTYVAQQALPFLKRGIRVNAICPGPTDTPLARANADMWLGFGADYREEAGIEPSTPLEQAYTLVFLCSDAAAGVTGQVLVTDAGYFASGITGSFEPARPVVEFLLGKF